jgi:iron complex outermembrane recepter protein
MIPVCPSRPRPFRLVAAALSVGVVWGMALEAQQGSGPGVELRALPGGGDARPDAVRPDTVRPDTVRPLPVTGVTVELLRAPVSLDRAPVAVSILETELSSHRGRAGTSLEEALQGLPGVHVQNRFNEAVGERITVRGFGSRSQFGVRGLRILVDGIPATLPDGQSTLDHLDLGSLGRAEALRGPAASLYGNAAGGVLSFTTRGASPARFEPEFRWIQGDHGLRRVQATASGTSAGDRTFLVTGTRQTWEGFRVIPGAEGGATYGAATRLQFNATGTAPLGGGTLRWTANLLDLDAENPGSLNQADVERGDRRAFPQNVTQRTGKTIRQGQLGTGWEGTVGGSGHVLELATWGIQRALSNPLPAAIVDVDRVAGGVRGLLRSGAPGPGASAEGSSRGGARFGWGVGAESELQVDDRENWTNVLGNRQTRTIDQRERVLGGALFGQARIAVTDQVDGTLGVRYDRIRFSARDRMERAPGAPDESGTRTMDALSPSVGVHWALRPALGVYVNVATTFETPTTTELANRPEGAGGFNAGVQPQRGRTVEFGARGRLGTLAVWEIAAFQTDLTDELVPFEVESSPGRRYFRNAGRSERQGWEAALRVTPHPWVDGRLSFSRNDARFREYVVGTQDFSGRKVPGLAPHRLEGILRVGEPGRWFAELRGESTAQTPSNDANAPNALSPAYRLLDARIGGNRIALGSGFAVSPFLSVTNLLDRAYNSSVTVNAFGGRFFEPGPGRSLTFGGSVLRVTPGR